MSVLGYISLRQEFITLVREGDMGDRPDMGERDYIEGTRPAVFRVGALALCLLSFPGCFFGGAERGWGRSGENGGY
jgi:hypothetical protein